MPHFSPFNCCLSVVLQLEKGDYPENSHVVFCPNKRRSFEPFVCLDLVDQNGFYTQTTQSEILNQKKKKKKKEQKTHKAVVLTVQTVLEINVATSPDYLLCWGLTVIVGWAI